MSRPISSSMWTGVTPVRDTWSICWWYDCRMSLLRELLLSLWIYGEVERHKTYSTWHYSTYDHFSVIQFSQATLSIYLSISFNTQGLMSPYLRASITNFKQSPMSWYEVTPVRKQINIIAATLLFFIKWDFDKENDLLFLMRTHNCSTKSKSPRPRSELKIGVSVSVFVVFKKR